MKKIHDIQEIEVEDKFRLRDYIRRLALAMITGTRTNDSAQTGEIGEYTSSSLAFGSAVSLTTGVDKTVVSLSLTPGDWDVSIGIHFTGGVTTTVGYLIAEINNTVDHTDQSVMGEVTNWVPANAPATPFNFNPIMLDVGCVRRSLASTTTIYANVQASFGVSTCVAWGIIKARRVR